MKKTIMLLQAMYATIFALALIILAEFLSQPRVDLATEDPEVFVSASDAQEAEMVDYTKYIPIYDNGVESNLYDRLYEKHIIYFKRDDCKDCQKYHDIIMDKLYMLNYPYTILEVSKEAESYEGLAIPSAVVKAIGVSEVPTLAFIKNGRWLKKIENEFTISGTEITIHCQEAFQSGI